MRLTQEQKMEPEPRVQLKLKAQEKECAVRYEMVHNKLESLDKRMWRLEAMIMSSTLAMVAMAVTVFMGVI